MDSTEHKTNEYLSHSTFIHCESTGIMRSYRLSDELKFLEFIRDQPD